MRRLEKLCFIVVFLSVFLHFSQNASLTITEQKKYKSFLEGQGLFSADDDVEVLTIQNFKTAVIDSDQAWIVEFYNSWCGFCQRFAPSWKALGTDIKAWGDLVKVAAFDCSVEENFPICREYEIMAYPTLRYFHEKYEAGPKKLGVDVSKGDDMDSHRRLLVERLITEQREGRGTIYPDLLPYNHSIVDNIFTGNSEIKHGFLVVVPPEDTLGAEIVLDLHRVPETLIRYSLSNNSGLVNNLQLAKFPALIYTDRVNNQILSQGEKSRDDLRLAIKNFLHSKKIEISDERTSSKPIFKGKWIDAEVPDMGALIQERARQALKERVKKMGDVVFQMDLETALRYSLKHEISSVKTIQGEKLDAFKAYVNILRKYFPFGHGGKIFLAELEMEIADKSEVEGGKIFNIVKKAEEEESQVFSSPSSWLGCKGSTPEHRGYPCGLWKLFHYLTVNAADQNQYNKSANPREVLEGMHGYIKNYFGCADCSQHFQQMATRRDLKNVSSLNDSILWLWMAHNEVNKRLAGDQTEDPEYPKYQFPSEERCSLCKNADKTWNLHEVLSYIKNMYSSLNVRYIGSDTRILHLGLEGSSSDGFNSTSGGVFKTLDMTGVSEKAVRARPPG